MSTEISYDKLREAIDHPRWKLAQAIRRGLMSMIEEARVAECPSVSEIYRGIERPPEQSLGDYAIPCFRFGKPVGQKPQDIALHLKSAVPAGDNLWIKSIDVVGAFLNVRLNIGLLASDVVPSINGGNLGAAFRTFGRHQDTRVMIEYSQPNTHKIFHVGHMRNVALGDSLWRLYDYCGYPVHPVNYIGDEGAHIAKCLWYIRKLNMTAPTDRQGEWLGEMYTKATLFLEDANEADKALFETEISEILRAIESKHGPIFELWRQTRQWSMDIFHEIYDWVGARFDHYFYESEVSEESQTIVDEYLTKGIFVEDQGAIGLDLKPWKLGFCLLRKRDGNTLYATKDLALARHKFERFKIDRSIYVVASEQNLHFRQVFKTLELMGFEQAKNCFHLSYGMVVLPDGKMSSRKGNIIAFSELKDRMSAELGKYLTKYVGEWTQEELDATNRKLCVGAIRYGMICSDPAKDIVFDLQDWLSFEGNTGPYLMYSFARTQSILRKSEVDVNLIHRADLTVLSLEEERDLLSYLVDFNIIVEQACETNRPSTLAHHLYHMCKAYNRFHTNVSVLKADTEKLKHARLALLRAFSQTLKTGLGLLGMEAPEKM